MPILTVATPATDRALVTLARVKVELSITDAASDDLLTGWIIAESARICDVCGVAADQKGRRTFLAEECVVSLSPSEVGRGPIIMPWRIPVAVSAVLVDGAPLASDEYEVEPMAGLVWRLDAADHRIDWPSARIAITMDGGWDAEDLPAPLTEAALALVTARWFAKDRDPSLKQIKVEGEGEETYWVGGTSTDGGLPSDIAGILAPYCNPVVG